MENKDIQEIVAKLSPRGKMAFLPAASKEQVVEFENKNSISFPLKYKEWLQYSDGGELFLPAGIQFYGVAHKPLIDVNAEDRPSDNYVVIGALSSGDPILFEKKSEIIAIYNIEANRIEADEIYEDFAAFLNDIEGILGIED